MKDNNKKKGLALLISLTALLVFAGTLVAYFSDKVTGETTIKAGTLDISGAYTITYNGVDQTIDEFVLDNFNPGDTLVVKANFTNAGTKSAWVRDTLTLSEDLATLTDSNGVPVIKVYSGIVTDFESATPITFTEGSVTSDQLIINGSVEDETEFGGVGSYEVAYTIHFSTTAGNAAQGLELNLNFETKALQYRNNNNPSEDLWNLVESFDLQNR